MGRYINKDKILDNLNWFAPDMDLIKRQKAEIEKLKVQNEKLQLVLESVDSEIF